MSQTYDYKKVYITEDEVQEMLMNIGGAIETLNHRLESHDNGPAREDVWLPYFKQEVHEVIDGLKRSREIGAQILCDVTADEYWSVYDEDSELVAVDVEAQNEEGALGQFVYAKPGWYARRQEDD